MNTRESREVFMKKIIDAVGKTESGVQYLHIDEKTFFEFKKAVGSLNLILRSTDWAQEERPDDL